MGKRCIGRCEGIRGNSGKTAYMTLLLGRGQNDTGNDRTGFEIQR